MYTATIAFGSTAGTILPDELPSTEIIPISDEDQIDIAPSSKCVAEGMNVFVQLKDGRHYVGNLNNVGIAELLPRIVTEKGSIRKVFSNLHEKL